MERVVLSWSGGKDAAFALSELERQSASVDRLLTTINETTDRSTMHGVRRELYEAQANALDRPIDIVTLPEAPSNEQYAAIMNDQLATYVADGFDFVAFGDLQLADVRAYRESRLKEIALEGRWPVWDRDTREFVDAFVDAGFQARIVAANAEYFDQADTGRTLTRSFIDSLPEDVDPAGENGEFHTVVTDGPIFHTPIDVRCGERVTRTVGEETRMHYCDLELESRG